MRKMDVDKKKITRRSKHGSAKTNLPSSSEVDRSCKNWYKTYTIDLIKVCQHLYGIVLISGVGGQLLAYIKIMYEYIQNMR
jgi:hypothetical protein